jgi:organic hydroperoxide reductase OsmC/OhrA
MSNVAISAQRLRPVAPSFLASGPGGEREDAKQLFAAAYAACLLGATKLVARQVDPIIPEGALRP